ncbi:MAG: capsid protein [Rhodospirillaceae bacterium]|nr:capsid protein [Rhodospirillaceae bacterium]
MGAINSHATDVYDLFLKVFSGEILTTFEENAVMKDLHTIRTISSGKSAQFPVTGVASAKYHTPGQNIADSGNSYLSEINHNEKVINIDKLLVASTFISNWDELVNHYDVRSVYAQELGKALAKRFDLATMKTIAAAGRASANVTGGKGGSILVGLSSTPTAAEIADQLFAAAQKLDENDVPNDGTRFALVSPRDYYALLASNETVIDRDFGGSGDVSSGNIPLVAGLRVIKSNHVSDVTKATGDLDADDGNALNNPFGDTAGYNNDLDQDEIYVAHPSAIGTVKLLDLATESEYKIELQGTLFVAKYAMGHGVLRPEAAVIIQ